MKDPPLATSNSVNNCCIYFLFIGNLSLTAVPLYILPPRLVPAICGGNGLHVSVNCCPRRDFAQKAKFRGGSLVPRPSLLIRSPREVWERAGERTRSRWVSLGDVTAHGRVQEWPSRKRLGTRLPRRHSSNSRHGLLLARIVRKVHTVEIYSQQSVCQKKSRFARRGATR